jgi:hypothetical protein
MNERAKNAAALRVREQDVEKVQGTIKQFVRDWSAGVSLSTIVHVHGEFRTPGSILIDLSLHDRRPLYNRASPKEMQSTSH